MNMLSENVTGDYAAYMDAASVPGNNHFVFMAPFTRSKTVESFLASHVEKGVVYVASESAVDVEFWIAAPQSMCAALERSLHKWAYQSGDDIPPVEAPRRGIFHAIMGKPAHTL